MSEREMGFNIPLRGVYMDLDGYLRTNGGLALNPGAPSAKEYADASRIADFIHKIGVDNYELTVICHVKISEVGR